MRKCRVVLYRRSINGWETGGHLFVRCWPHKPCPNEFRRRRQHICTRTLWKPWTMSDCCCIERWCIAVVGCPAYFAFDLLCIGLLLAGWLAGWSQQKCRRWTSLADLSDCAALPPSSRSKPASHYCVSPSAWAHRKLCNEKKKEPTRTGQTGCGYLQKKRKKKIVLHQHILRNFYLFFLRLSKSGL